VGELFIADISMPHFVEQSPDIKVNLVEESDVIITSPTSDSHKYSNGKVFILAGSSGMTGAAVLAANGAAVSGTGLVVLGIARTLNNILETKLTEQLTLPLADNQDSMIIDEALSDIKMKIDWADAFLIGPGMGRDEQTLKIINEVILYAISQKKKMVIDADALFMLSKNSDLLNTLYRDVVITPHYGEFLRLSGGEKESLRKTPWQSAANFSEKYSCILDLKGAPSMAAQEGNLFINSSGNAGLAKGGSGDILSGLIAGLLARNIEPLKAVYYANYYHGRAADLALQEYGSFSYQPQDILPYLKRLI
jgi:NAD(P)H-hydrate epimerase